MPSATAIDPDRKGPSRPTEVEPHVREALSRGAIESVNCAEGLAVEFHTLLFHAAPTIGEPAIERMRQAAGEGVTKRVRIAAELLLTRFGPSKIDEIARQHSDTARGWAATMVGMLSDVSLDEKLDLIRPFADDPHYGVREWAWMAVRPGIVDAPLEAIGLLTPWVSHHQPNVRRFAVESTRPRGVWCAHITQLKADPSPGLPLLEPLKNDGEKYVQDAVANWLNDAGKTNGRWVLDLTERWLAESDTKATRRIVTRARRNL